LSVLLKFIAYCRASRLFKQRLLYIGCSKRESRACQQHTGSLSLKRIGFLYRVFGKNRKPSLDVATTTVSFDQ